MWTINFDKFCILLQSFCWSLPAVIGKQAGNQPGRVFSLGNAGRFRVSSQPSCGCWTVGKKKRKEKKTWKKEENHTNLLTEPRLKLLT